jgi:hypothetical protein
MSRFIVAAFAVVTATFSFAARADTLADFLKAGWEIKAMTVIPLNMSSTSFYVLLQHGTRAVVCQEQSTFNGRAETQSCFDLQ